MTQARHMQLLRLALSAMMEGLVGGKVRVGIALEASARGAVVHCRSARELAQFLYRADPASITGVRIDFEDGRASYDSLASFVGGPLKRSVRLALAAAFSEESWLRFEAELRDSLVNEARALSAEAATYGRLRELLSARGEASFLHYLTRNPAADRDLAGVRHDTASLFTQIGSFSGHRTHPCAKTRLLQQPDLPTRIRPLTQEDHQAYAPECAPDVALALLAVRRDRLTVSLSESCRGGYEAFFTSAFPDALGRWRELLTATKGDAADRYAPVPIHPLQAEIIRSHFADPIAAGDIVFLPGAAIIQRPTISFRTLMPVRRPSEPQIKTSLTMQMTSVLRTLAPARAYNAPVFSDLLLRLTADDAAMGQWLRPLAEPVAVYWGTDARPQSEDYRSGYHLAALFKANPSTLQRPREIAIPLNTLLSPSPASGERLIVEMMRDAGIRTSAEALDYFRAYAGIVLGVDIGMLARYGISLETHQQNTDLIFDHSGSLSAVGYRDISGGLEICEPLLIANGHDIRPALHPNIKGLFDAPAIPLQQTIYVSFITHLFPVVDIVSAAFGVPEARLFAILAETVRRVLAEARERHVPGALAKLAPDARGEAARLFHQMIELIERQILRQPIAVKSLLRMRAAQSQAVGFSAMANPLIGH
jgi:siderophore synthetase component